MSHTAVPETTAVDKLQTSVVAEWAKREPVVIAAIVAWLLLQLHNAVVSHWHWFTEPQWTSVNHYAVPLLTGAITAGVAWVLRKFTAPWLKVKPQLEAKAQQIVLGDAELGYLAAHLVTVVGDHVATITAAQTAAKAIPAGPPGMGAGAPPA